MEIVLAVVIGGLYAAGLYLMLRRSIARMIMGLALLTNASNLLIFTSAGLTRGRPPLIPEGAVEPEGAFADPLPQSLILTAIVIGFGVLAFAMVLAYTLHRTVGIEDMDDCRSTDRPVGDPPPDADQDWEAPSSDALLPGAEGR